MTPPIEDQTPPKDAAQAPTTLEGDELQAKRAELTGLQAELAERELALATLPSELRAFESRYLETVGRRYAELDRIEAQTAQASGVQPGEQAGPAAQAPLRLTLDQESARAADLAGAGRGSVSAPPDTLKDLFRESVKRMHPSLSTEPAGAARRAEAMKDVVSAYRAGDEDRLRAILREWEARPGPANEEEPGAESARVLRQIVQVWHRFYLMEPALTELRKSEVHELMMRAAEKEALGVDILSVLADSVNKRIRRARRRLARSGRGKPKGTEHPILAPGQTSPSQERGFAQHAAALVTRGLNELALLELAASPPAPSALGDILAAAERGDERMVRGILRHHPESVNARDEHGLAPLHLATAYGHGGVVKLLLASGAEVNARDEDGGTPLHHAASHGLVAVADLLLAKGAAVGAADDNGWTPLHWAAWDGHVGVVEALLGHGAEVDARMQYGWTPLHWAARDGHAGVVHALLAHGADADGVDEDGRTPLSYAAGEGQAQAAEALLAHGASVDAPDGEGWTPLHQAAAGGHADAVDVLLDWGADLHAVTATGATALALSAAEGYTAVAGRLQSLEDDLARRGHPRELPA